MAVKKIPQVDAYIKKCQPFAQPILEKLRAIVHKACPNVEEAMKWSAPHFMHHGILAGMAGFKQHVSFALWRGKELPDPDGLFVGQGRTQMCALKISSVDEIPSQKVMTTYLKAAMVLNETVVTDKKTAAKTGKELAKKAAKKDPKSVKAPADLMAALKKNKKALAAFEGFAYSHRKEYVEWITEAKREETRAKRIATAVEWMGEGKSRNWKYQNC